VALCPRIKALMHLVRMFRQLREGMRLPWNGRVWPLHRLRERIWNPTGIIMELAALGSKIYILLSTWYPTCGCPLSPAMLRTKIRS
jgi:hypothetical protein